MEFQLNCRQYQPSNIHTLKWWLFVITYLHTPWSRVLLEMLTSKLCSSSRNSPHLWNPKVPHRTHKCLPPVPITLPDNKIQNYNLQLHYYVILSRFCENKRRVGACGSHSLHCGSYLPFAVPRYHLVDFCYPHWHLQYVQRLPPASHSHRFA